jgi:hypothetical protein
MTFVTAPRGRHDLRRDPGEITDGGDPEPSGAMQLRCTGRSFLTAQIQCDRSPGTAVDRADLWRIYMRPHMIHEACVTE